MNHAVIDTIRQRLLAFYHVSKRQLPWRMAPYKNHSYAIWVSEIMLQQTQVDTVIPRYHAFLKQFPTVATLAQASEYDVCEAWAGLGYYRRARFLHAAAQVIMQQHAGKLPADLAALQHLPGIGPYTAGAIASIAFNIPAAIVDGNVERVLSRIFTLEDPPKSTLGKKKLWHIAHQLAQSDTPGDVNQALMEQGALVCLPSVPLCDRCCVALLCGANQQSQQAHYPVSDKAIKRQVLPVAFAYITSKEGVWLQQRGLDGLWAGLWELPSAMGQDALAILQNNFKRHTLKKLGTIKHELTHRRVEATIYQVTKPAHWRIEKHLRPYKKPLEAPLSTLARRAIVWVGRLE